MGALKQLHTSDINVTPYTANKIWSFTYTSTPNDGYITYYTGTNTSFSPSGTTTTNGEYNSSIYALANQLYYQSYTSSLDTSSLANSNYYESASTQRPTSSYFKNTDIGFIPSFPSGSGDSIGMLGISSRLYGNNILPYSFQILSSSYIITDDGKGNLYDITFISSLYVSSSYVLMDYVFPDVVASQSFLIPPLVGNIFYSQGTCTITNPAYINTFIPSTSSLLILDNISSYDLPSPLYTYFYYATQSYTLVYISASFKETLGIGNQLQVFTSGSTLYDSGVGNFLSGSTINLFLSCSLPSGSFIEYATQGNATILSSSIYTFTSSINSVNVSFKNNYTIHETEIRCTIKESEYNLSYNPTLQTGTITSSSISGSNMYYTDGTLKNFATSSNFSPYVTTLGLYSDNDELLAVAKFSKPLLVSPDTDTTFIVKYDI
jgi:hypothetical protein